MNTDNTMQIWDSKISKIVFTDEVQRAIEQVNNLIKNLLKKGDKNC